MTNDKSADRSAAKKRIILIVAICTAAVIALAVLGWALIRTTKNSRMHENELENVYQRSFYELTDASSNLELSLSKMLVASSQEQNSVLTMQAYKNAETAMDALTRLPLEHIDVAKAEKFYNQVGDFCFAYNKSLAYGVDCAAFDEKIEQLYITARQINQMILNENEQLAQNGYSFTRMSKGKAEQNRNSEIKSGQSEDNSYSSIEYPELIYDGPFSDSTSDRCYKALENLPQISFEQAEQIVMQKLPLKITSTSLLGETLGAAPCYVINASSDEGEVICSVSKNGGLFINVSYHVRGGEKRLSDEQAKEKACQYAQLVGYDVKPVWYNEIDGVATVNLAPIVDDVVYYTDLVKVKVSLENGKFGGLEATGYCMNNCTRTLEPVLSADEASAKLSKKLNIENKRLCVVPDGVEKETLCYEISAEFKGLDYFIYIDALDGREINIMRVIDSNQGYITM